MRIKKFQGKSFKEVMDIVKNELGPDAVILSSTTKKDPLSNSSIVEITAALDDSKETTMQSVEVDDFERSLRKEIEKLKIELALIRESVYRLFPTIDDNSKGGLYSFMIKSGIEPHLALLLLEKVSDVNGLREVLNRDIKKIDGDIQSKKGFVFFGLPGVGKTTSLYKLGKTIRQNNHRLLLLSLDQRISAVAQIKEIALKLKCDAKILRDYSELYRIIHREIDRTKILVDTPGDEKISYDSELREVLKDFPIKKCLVMDASITASSCLKTLRNFDSQLIDCIAFSKIDLAYNFGNLYNISVYSGKPISFLTSGAYDDEKAVIYQPHMLSNMIIGGMCEN